MLYGSRNIRGVIFYLFVSYSLVANLKKSGLKYPQKNKHYSGKKYKVNAQLVF